MTQNGLAGELNITCVICRRIYPIRYAICVIITDEMYMM